MTLLAEYVERIGRARVYEVAIESPLEHAPRLSARLGNHVYLKREDLQPVFSFKLRGAHNKIAHMPPTALRHGVICSSAGNHAQGVALAALKRGVRAVVVLPENTPSIKIEAVRALGGEIVLHGDAFDDANAHALTLARKQKLEFIHAFADPDVIAGQGTIAIELMRQWTNVPKAVFVPIGGGGLVAGIGTYLKYHFPSVKIIGVQPLDAAAMHASLLRGALVTLDHVGIFADGVAVRRVSDETLGIAREVVDRIVLVDTDEICAAIKDIFEDTRGIMEPAGALAIAGLKRYLELNPDRDSAYTAINSGANLNFDRLRHISERTEIGEKREALLAVEIPERPGEFLRFCEAIGTRNVTEFNYRYTPALHAQIFVGISLRGARKEAQALVEQLTASGYKVMDLSDNELAKVHLRHMIGGRVPSLRNELIYRFEFPERPGALLKFLRAIGKTWNISLFHYRNHGSNFGRVLAGLEIPPDDRKRFTGHLETLGYSYTEETSNPAYRSFLGSP
jgi:threonine dehydratase